MTVPEAAVNEDRQTVLGEYDVGFARKVLAVQAEASAECVQRAPDRQFRLGVLAPDTAHVLAAPLWIEMVHF